MPETRCEMHQLSLMSAFVYGSALTSVIIWVKCDIAITQISFSLVIGLEKCSNLFNYAAQ